ncbi:integumentary mucin A.1-like [Poecilia formosa]|uniref:integumentary mucin A.1-like n=1 Tax=Poecilia formosa TaxID=48698 RepID=UPI0007B951F0|nr:PREDICTED: integumentary mucin A.1-like [Poecilia formosa]
MTTDAGVVEQLRNISYPISLSESVQLSTVNISTVCSPYNTSYQCRCEDQYGWPCDMCSTYGQCNNVLDSTCGCINALLPNNTYCQPLSDLDVCPTPTPSDSVPAASTSANITTTVPTTNETAPTPSAPTTTSTLVTNSTQATINATTPSMTTAMTTSTLPLPTPTSTAVTNSTQDTTNTTTHPTTAVTSEVFYKAVTE